MPIIIDENGAREIPEEEYEVFFTSLFTTWSKQGHIAEINKLHDDLFRSILDKYNYIDMAELNMWATQENSQYKDEANEIIKWYIFTYSLIENYASSITEEIAVSPNFFVANLPIYPLNF